MLADRLHPTRPVYLCVGSTERTATAYTSFLTGCSPQPTVENFSKGTCGRNDRSIIILTKETAKLSALLATSTQNV